MNTLSQKLGYTFKNGSLLNDALRHRSAKGNNNERLEFLGDAILNFVITAALYKQHPYVKEGELSRFRANLVKGETLALLAQKFYLGNHLELGASELRTGGFARKSILIDAIEAVVGAIYLDGGIEACEECILRWFADHLSEPLNERSQKDSKSLFQEYLQAHQLPLPCYTVTKVEGFAHQQRFYIRCTVKGVDIETQGTGSNRRTAEQEAATLFLEELKMKINQGK
jgi:ribonuclease-3